MLGAIIGGVLAGGASLLGSSKAANAQSDASAAQLALQREMFDRMDELQGDLYGDQRKTINRGTRDNIADINGTQGQQIGLANLLAGYGMQGAQQTRNQNVGLYRRERNKGVRQINRATDRSIGGIKDARGRAIDPFRPAMRLGNNALRAFAENLGVGAAPGYSMEMTPGNRYLLDEGQKALEGSAAAGGGLYSGAAMEELQRHAMGIAAQDRQQQQAELFGLAGMGQGAAGTVAGLRTGAAENIANLRTGGAHAKNALRQGYGDRIAGANDQLFGQLYGIGGDWTQGVGGALDAGLNRRIGARDFRTTALGTARTNRANLQGQAAGQYMQGAGQAYQNQANAGMLQGMGWQNALASGINTGFGLHGYMGGQFPGMANPQALTPPPVFGTGGQGALY